MKEGKWYKKKRIWAFVLAFALVVSAIPKIVFVSEAEVPGTKESGEGITVTYSQDPAEVPEGEDAKFYQAGCTAEVTVKIKDCTADEATFAAEAAWDLKGRDASGIAWTRTEEDGLTVYKTSVPFTEDGAYSLGLKVTDAATHKDFTYGPDVFLVDQAGPEVGGFSVESDTEDTREEKSYEAADGTVWHNKNVTISFTAKDTLSGLKSVSGAASDPAYHGFQEEVQKTYGLAEAEISGVTAKRGEAAEQSFSVKTNGDGKYQLAAKAEDFAGNQAVGSSGVIGIDLSAPAVTATVEPEGWTNSDVTVTFAPSDAGSGVAKVYYAKKGETDGTLVEAKGGAYTQEFSGDVSEYECWAEDNVGNVSARTPFTMSVDREAPELSVTVDRGEFTEVGGKEWTDGDVKVTFRPEDGKSGVADVYFQKEGEAAVKADPAGDGTYTHTFTASGANGKYTAWAVDNVGNAGNAAGQGKTAEFDVWIDKAAPTVTAKVDEAGWANGDVTVTFTPADSESGVSCVYFQKEGANDPVKVDGTGGAYSYVFSTEEDAGKYTAWAVDNAGNAGRPGSAAETIEFEIKIDLTAPKIAAKADKEGWTNEDVTVTFEPEDTAGKQNAGIAAVYYKEGKKGSVELKDGTKAEPSLDGTYSVKFTEACNRTYVAWTEDQAGNVSEAAEFSVKIDRTEPTVTKIVFSKESGWTYSSSNQTLYGYYFKDSVTVTVNVSDRGADGGAASSGVKEICYRAVPLGKEKEDVEPVSVAVPAGKDNASFELKAGFKGQIYVTAKDNVGNESDEEHPDGIVVEDSALHEDNAGIEIVMPETGSKTAEGIPVYSHGNGKTHDLEGVQIKVWERYAGLSSITWEVIEGKDETVASGKADANGNSGFGRDAVEVSGNVDTASDGNWEKTGTSGAAELLTDAQGTLNIKWEDGYESDSLTLKVTLTDRAGFTFSASKPFGVDNKAPEIKVEYDVNNDPVGYLYRKQFYDKTRTATVSVSDLHTVDLDQAGLEASVRYAKEFEEGGEAASGKATVQEAGANSYTVTYPGDDTYRFALEVKDELGNTAYYPEQDGADIFTVDQTDPEIAFGEIEKAGEESGDFVRYPQTGEEDGVVWYNQDVKIPYSIADQVSGLMDVTVGKPENGAGSLNDFADMESGEFGEKNYQQEDHVCEADGKELSFGKQGYTEPISSYAKTNGSGKYQLAITASDYAGETKSSDVTKVIGIDEERPSITEIKLGGESLDLENSDAEGNTYRHYVKGKVPVSVKAEDNGSGLLTISYEKHYADGKVDSGTKDLRSEKPTVDGNGTKSYELTLFEIEEGFRGQIYVWTEDKVGNKSALAHPDGIIAETREQHKESSSLTAELPKTEEKDGNGLSLYKNDISIPITVEDTFSGIRKVEWRVLPGISTVDNRLESGSFEIGDDGALPKDASGWQAEKDKNLITKLQKTLTVSDNSNDILLEVTFTDRAGYTDTERVAFSIDKTRPEIKVEYDVKASSCPDKEAAYRKFYNEARTATVTVTERNFDEKRANVQVLEAIQEGEGAMEISGWDEYLAYENGTVSDETTHVCTVFYPGNTAYNFLAEATDLAGNKASASKNIFMVDMANPILKGVKRNTDISAVHEEDEGYYLDDMGDENRENDVEWYNGNVKISFQAKDGRAGLYQVQTEAYAMGGITGMFKEDVSAEYDLEEYVKTQNKAAVNYGYRGEVDLQEYRLVTTTKANKNEKYRYRATALDYAGNTVSASSPVIGIDREKPRITSIEFTGEGNQEGNWKEPTVAEMDYGYYFRSNTVVKVTATDENVNGSSGLDSIFLRLEGVDGTRRTVEPELQTGETGQFVTYTVPAGFKGQIYAYAADHVGNESREYQPDGVVNESEAQKAEATITVSSPETAYRDADGRPLYAADTTFRITAQDVHSGLSKVEWSVESDEDSGSNASGAVTVSADGQLSDPGWEVLKTDENLVTKIQRDITVHNNSNNIRLKVKLTDRAGNETEYNDGNGLVFSIDKTQPRIEVTYQENDASHDKYYNKDRTAVITVTERNFDEEATNMQMRLSNSEGSVPAYGTWTHGGEAGTDRATHTCRITYSEDGDYTFTMGAADKAAHTASYGNTDEFTIDQTKPEIEVSYSTDGLSNGIYYKDGCVATITVTEHNFDESGIEVTQAAELDGSPIQAPAGLSWSGTGDVHTATIDYSSDGDYVLSVSGQDMAANEMEQYAGTKFVVDTTEPEIEITDVEDKSAYSETVAPGVSFSDVNCDADSVKITLKGCKHEEKDLTGSLSRVAHGGSIRLGDFAHTVETDDVYTLTAEVTDMAGNSKEATKVFSVNRYGSNYVLGKGTQKLVNDYYSNEEEDVVINEINVNALETEGITCSRDGEMTSLEEKKDYDVKEAGTEYSSWKEYTYTIHADNFQDEGAYVVTVLSKDAAKNEMTNRTARTEDYGKEVEFVIDKTAPTIVPTGVEDNGQYVEAQREVKVDSQDNIAIDFVEVYLNGSGNPVQTWTQEDLAKKDGIMSYVLKAASDWQNLRFVAVDKAGNRKESDTIRCLLTTNVLVQFINNKAALIGTAVLAAICVSAGYVVFIRRRKKQK